LLGVFVTAFYTFRLVFMTFHGEERMDAHTREHLHESPWVVTVTLVLLAVPSVIAGWPTIGPLLFGDWFGKAIAVLPQHDVLGHLREEFHGPAAFVLHGLASPAVWLAAAGVAAAWLVYLKRPQLAAQLRERAGALYTLLANKYYFDAFNEKLVAPAARKIAHALWRGGDVAVIDGVAESRRRGRYRRRRGQRLGAPRRLGGRQAPGRAVGLPLSLRLCHDHRA